MFPLGEWANFQVSVADLSWSRGVLVQVTNLQLVTPGLVQCSASLTVGATIVNVPRIEIQMRCPSLIDMLTEFATDEHVDLKGELAARHLEFVPHCRKVDQPDTESQRPSSGTKNALWRPK